MESKIVGLLVLEKSGKYLSQYGHKALNRK